MENSALFKILDAVKAKPSQLLEYARKISKDSPLSVVFKQNGVYEITNNIIDNKEFVGVVIEEFVLFAETLADEDGAFTDLSAKDLRAHAQLLHPKARLIGLRQMEDLVAYKLDYEATVENLVAFGYKAPKLPAIFIDIADVDEDCKMEGNAYNAQGSCVGKYSFSYYASFNEFLFYCNVDELQGEL